MAKHNCEVCRFRAKHDAKPRSIKGRLWRWHINWCPGWRKYFASLSQEEQKSLVLKYRLKN